MADDNIVISAFIRVLDQASPVIKSIVGALGGVEQAASKAGGVFSGLSDKVGGAFKGISGSIKGFANEISSAFSPLAGLTGLAGLGGMTAAVVSFANNAREIGKTARSIGVTTDALQGFRFAAGDAEKADTILRNLRRTLVNLNKGGKGTKETVDLLAKMGVNADMIKAGKLEEILPLIAAGFEKNVDPQKQSAASMALFNRSWADALPVMQKGVAGLAEGADKAERLGIAVKDIVAGEQAAKAFKSLGDAVESAKNQFAAALLPVFTPMVEWLAKFVENNKELLGQIALPAFIAAITAAVIPLGIAVATALGPWGLLAAAIAAAAVAIIQNWGPIKEWFGKQFEALPSIAQEAVRGIADHYSRLWTNIKEGWKEGGLVGAAKGYWKTMEESAGNLATWVKTKFDAVDWSTVGAQASTAFGNAWTNVTTWMKTTWENLANAFGEIEWSTVGESIGKFLVDAILWPFKTELKIAEWIAELPWADIGKAGGQLLIDSFKLVFFDIPLFFADLLRKAVTGAATTDWTAVGASIDAFFTKLIGGMVDIGVKLIGGIIKGMLAAIKSSFGEVGTAIGEKLSGLRPAWLGGPRAGGEQASGMAAAAQAAARPNLLQAANANQESNVNTKIELTGVPAGMGATATTTQSGAHVNTNTEVGRGMEPSKGIM